MRKILSIVMVFSYSYLSGQNFFEKNDLALDYYRNLVVSYTSSLYINKITHRPVLSGLSGIVLGATSTLLERGLSGQVISSMGTITGQMFYVVTLNVKDKSKKEKERLEKYKINN
jgi:hypothetical protein